jgi:hypothetical protein
MNATPELKPPLTQRSPALRFVRWLFSPRILGRIAFVLFILGMVLVLFYAEEFWRGRRAWEQYKAEAATRDVQLDWEAFIPPKVPNDQNFAMTPLLAPLYDFLPGSQTWQDTNAFRRIEDRINGARQRARTMGFSLGTKRNGRWEKGEKTDLILLLDTNVLSKADSDRIAELGQMSVIPYAARADTETGAPTESTTNSAISVVRPATQEQAATTLLNLFSQTFDPAVDELRVASRRPFSRFDISYDYVPRGQVLLPHLSLIKSFVQQLSWRASAELVLGKNEEAFDDLLLGLYVSDSIRHEPIVVSHLVRIAARGMLFQVIWEGLSGHRWADDQLERLQAGLAKDDFSHDTQWVLMAERAGDVAFIQEVQTNAAVSLGGLLGGNDGNLAWPIRLLPKGWFYLERANLCRGFDSCLVPFEDWRSGKMDVKALFALWSQSSTQYLDQKPWLLLCRHRLFENLLVPAVSKTHFKGLQAQVRDDLARVACALERHYLAKRSYPETLETLIPSYLAKAPIDVMSGRPLIYRRESQQAYVLYSVGQNQLDEGGRLGLGKEGQLIVEEGDIVWRVQGK